jgi:hypothetical protein
MTKPFDIQLTPADRKKLLHAYRTAKDYLQRVCAHVLLLLDKGLSVDAVQSTESGNWHSVGAAWVGPTLPRLPAPCWNTSTRMTASTS